MKTDKWYWKVYVKRPLWKKVDRKRKGDNLKWTQLVEKMFEVYLHGLSVETPKPEKLEFVSLANIRVDSISNKELRKVIRAPKKKNSKLKNVKKQS